VGKRCSPRSKGFPEQIRASVREMAETCSRVVVGRQSLESARGDRGPASARECAPCQPARHFPLPQTAETCFAIEILDVPTLLHEIGVRLLSVDLDAEQKIGEREGRWQGGFLGYSIGGVGWWVGVVSQPEAKP
jgi:hypothetical protein